MSASQPSLYDEQFYAHQAPGSLRSAQQIVPLVRELIDPRSVLDLGCGAGTFLKVFSDAGVSDVLGLDGDYVPRDKLLIAPDRFRPADLAAPIRLGRRFDLAMSLEVAEHLPPEAAPAFVKSLTDHSDVVLFSAAVPGQTGTGHINEQWPSYWAKLFAAQGMRPYDVIRSRIWGDPSIAWWYRQNCLMFARPDHARKFPRLSAAAASALPAVDIVHPEMFAKLQQVAGGISAELAAITSRLAAGEQFQVRPLPNGKFRLTRTD